MLLLLDAERLEIRPPQWSGGIEVEHAWDAHSQPSSMSERAPRPDLSMARTMRSPSDASEQPLAHLDVGDRGAGRRQRPRPVEAAEGEPGLVIHQVRAALPQPPAPACQAEELVGRFDRSLLAREAGDVAAGATVRRLGVDEGAPAAVGAEAAGRRIVSRRLVGEVDGGLEADERRMPAPRDDPSRLERRADGPGLAGVGVDVHLGARHSLEDVGRAGP